MGNDLKFEKVTRHAFSLVVYEGQEAEYRRRHDEIWLDLLKLQQRAGLMNFSLFQRGREVIGYYEHHAESAEITLEEFDADPLVADWDRYMSGVIESVGDELQEIWHA
jgi:L-rhamnose mutarotase